MADRSPGEPLNQSNLPISQGLPYDGFVVPSHDMHVGNGQYQMMTPSLVPVQLDHAQYKSSDVPLKKLITNYKP